PALDQCCGGRMRLAFALLTGEDLPRLGEGAGTVDSCEGAGASGRDDEAAGAEDAPGGPSFVADSRPEAPAGRGASAMLELWPGGPVWREPEAPRQVVVYGAGHVGTALVRALAPLPFRVAWVDARSGACAGAPDGVETHETPLPEAVTAAAEPDALHVVLTHSHVLDLEIVTAVLGRPFGFCGLIGSGTKRAVLPRPPAVRGAAIVAI